MIGDAAAHGSPALVVGTTSSAAVLVLTVAAEWEIPVAYVSGLAMGRAVDLYAGAAKTDPKDARVLAGYAWRNADRLTWTSVTDELLAGLCILNGRDTDLAGDATRAANRLRDALLAVSPALERAVGDKLGSVPGLRSVLMKWSTLSALRAAGKARVRGEIAKRSGRSAPSVADEIGAAQPAQTVTVVTEAAWGETIGDLAADLDRIISRRDQLEAGIGAAFLEHPLGKVLNTMCGFGPRTGARTLAEIGDPHRFANPARLAAYAGLAPVNWQSGRTSNTRKPRGGNYRLKNAMFIAAFVATQHPRLLPTQMSQIQHFLTGSYSRQPTLLHTPLRSDTPLLLVSLSALLTGPTHEPFPRALLTMAASFLQSPRPVLHLLLKLANPPLESLTLRGKRNDPTHQEPADDRNDGCGRLLHGGQKPIRVSHEVSEYAHLAPKTEPDGGQSITSGGLTWPYG